MQANKLAVASDCRYLHTTATLVRLVVHTSERFYGPCSFPDRRIVPTTLVKPQTMRADDYHANVCTDCYGLEISLPRRPWHETEPVAAYHSPQREAFEDPPTLFFAKASHILHFCVEGEAFLVDPPDRSCVHFGRN